MKTTSIVILTGAGISAESGLRTFRDSDGLWENYRVEEVATPKAWDDDPELVLRFYNQRRRDIERAAPNAGHLALAELEKDFEVQIVTQNIDDLHERAGSSSVLHLHGIITKAQSSKDPELLRDIGYRDILAGDRCPLGSQLRPHIVWFGEAVPAMEQAVALVQQAELLMIIGTSMQVYPAAGLADFYRGASPVYYVDPSLPPAHVFHRFEHIKEPASSGVAKACSLIRSAGC
ncbi:MAG: NAD-dependent deacylase [Bdellovibrionales bacterium]|nr:NAD-dependent deacylase [Bdellovibrionales bacterium]